jgi:6-phosphogluconolactonase/glucosamine-6-phosphate isomerase/deaminase
MFVVKKIESGKTVLHICSNEAEMGMESAILAIQILKEASFSGKHPVMWMMAAPSGFAFYEAFVSQATEDKELQDIIKRTKFFQFDDYPVDRNDSRFPITFRHLLESNFFKPLENIVGPLQGIDLMELKGDESDDKVISEYQIRLQNELSDPSSFVLEIKGIGMDGHWGFHGSETPLDASPGIMRVRMNELNVQQQMIDWPQYFKTADMVPSEAVTANVGLFMQADAIIDLVPQYEKAFAVLACYGKPEPSGMVPSSQLKLHEKSYSFLTEKSAWALIKFRNRRLSLRVENDVLESSMIAELSKIWNNPENRELENHNRNKMKQVLEAIF